MHIRSRLIVFFLFSTILTIFCCPVHSETVPQRIISLTPSITENIFTLGAQDRLIGVTAFCDYPPEARDKAIVGTLTDPNIELIVALSPDLILTAGEMIGPHNLASMKRMGLTVKVLENCRDFDDIIERFIELGRMIGEYERAVELADSASAQIELLTKNTDRSQGPTVFWEVDGRPLITIGSDSFQNGIIEAAGGRNVFEDVDNDYFRVSMEQAVMRDPDVVILSLHDKMVDEERARWSEFKDVRAVREGRIRAIDINLVSRPTPFGFVNGAKAVRAILYGSPEDEEARQ